MRTSGRSSRSCIRMTLAVWPFLSRTSSGSPGWGARASAVALASEAALAAAARASDALSSGLSAGLSAGVSAGFCTWYLTILRSILMVMVSSWELRSAHRASHAPVIPVLDRIKQIRRGVELAVVIDLLIAACLHDRAVLERELIDRVLEVLLLHQHALERFRVEAEGGAALKPLLVCVQIDVLELRVGEIRRHVRRLRNR